ncbi:hypothetical protein BDV93DRAFT_294391 [Ceratobasidium sp. AG-I]|nr:hypothetical protein BDV93DRAFT_294391 [Ceratobasidium sp. AG-I]
MYFQLTSRHNSQGPCRDFFLSHLGDPYPTTVQKHQILKQSSPDFTLRSLNLWFVNIRRRSKWMDIFKKHAGSKRDAMRDLVARVEAQVAGRPAPNPLPSGATPPGLKVEQEVVDDVMSMRAVVDMVSREVYGEGWDQILQIKPWTDEEVRAHEERKKASRREARASKADGEKRKREREEQRERRKRDREARKLVEQEAVDGIRAARELHGQLMAMSKRKRDDVDEGSVDRAKRHRNGKEVEVDENGQPKQRKIRVPKVDEQGNPLTKEQRKAIKKAILASQGQVNPLKRKSPDLGASEANTSYPSEAPNFLEDTLPSKRRRRDAATFDRFPTSQEAESMVDLSQLFSVGWASPPRESEPLPSVENPPSPASNPGYSEFAHPSGSQAAIEPSAQGEKNTHVTVEGEVPRRFSQQLAAYALESGMLDGESFELFTEDTFPGMAVEVNAENSMEGLFPPPAPHHQGASMSVSPVQTEPHTRMPGFTASIQTQHYESYAPAHPHGHTPPSPYSSTSTITATNGDADSDMSWINAALAQLPSEHDTHHQIHHQYTLAPGSEQTGQHPGPQSNFAPTYGSDSNSYGPRFASSSERRAPISHQRTSLPFPSPRRPQNNMPPPAPSTSPSQARHSFPQPQARPPAPQQVFQAPPQPHSHHQQRQRAPGELWQTPYSQPTPSHQYQQPAPSFPAPSPTPSQSSSRSFPAPTPQHSGQSPYSGPSYERRNAYSQPGPSSPERGPGHEQESQHTPIYPPSQQQYSHPATPVPQPSLSPMSNASDILKQHELEFARAQEELQNRFKREQEEQLARFMRAQEDLRKQLPVDSQSERC